ncbi:ArsA family ATPase [Halobacteriaceae archaeon GCM10025711]
MVGAVTRGHGRVRLLRGKGGVGKTTTAAATALQFARAGKRTLVVSTDPAHSLSDSFEASLTGDPVAVADGLWAVEIDPAERRAAYRRIVAALAADFREAGLRLDEAEVDSLFAAGIAPGGEEVAALDAFAEYAASGRWDRIVVDTAPTGHTLRLLALPEAVGSAMETTARLRSQVRRLTDTARSMLFGPAAYFGRGEDEAGTDIEGLRERMERVRDMLRDPDRTEFRVVLVPELMAVRETERLVERLREDGFPVSTLVVNKVLTDVDERCDRCRARRDAHRERLAEIRRLFPDLEIRTLPLLREEVHGVESLGAVADELATG